MKAITINTRIFLRRLPNEGSIKNKTTDELRELYTKLAGKLESIGLEPEDWPEIDLRGLTRKERNEKEQEIVAKQCLHALAMFKEYVSAHTHETSPNVP